MQKQKISFTGHVLREPGGDALQISEGKLEATTAQGRPRRMWLHDIKQWTQLNTYEDNKRLAQGRFLVESLHRGMATF